MTNCTLISTHGTWTDVANVARATIGLGPKEAEPNIKWQRRMLMAEHSPIRLISYIWRWDDLPYWVSVHFARHKIGCEHFVRTQRSDRTGVDRNELRQDSPVSHTMTANQQAIINISRKRLCFQASKETREVWKMALLLLPQVLQDVCGPDCAYRGGFCYEMTPCHIGPAERIY